MLKTINVLPTKDIGVEGVLDRGEGNLSEWANALNTSVVDEHIDFAVLVENGVDHLPHALIRFHIELLQEEPLVVLESRHARPRPAGGHHAAPVRGEGACERVAYPTIGASRDENHRLIIIGITMALHSVQGERQFRIVVSN